MPSEDSIWIRALTWAWTNWPTIAERVEKIYNWFGKQGAKPTSPGPGILLIGPGGTGKTTLARLLSGEYTTRLFEEPWAYHESIAEERYTLLDDSGVEVIVPPGQASRREAAWADVRADLTGGRYRGVVMVVSNGYHMKPMIGGFKNHPLYKGNKEQFVADLLAQQQEDELRVLQYLRPALEGATEKVWLLVLVTKQDL